MAAMKRRALPTLASVLAALLAAQPVFAVSLYSKPVVDPVKGAPLSNCVVPALPPVGLEGVPSVPQLNIPGALPKLEDAPAVPSQPVVPAEPSAPIEPITPISPIVKPIAAAATPGVSAQNPALGSAQNASASVAKSADQGGTQSQAALGSLFDGGLLDAAKSLFHPGLPAGQAPAVAARTSSPVAPDAVPTDDAMNARMALSPLTNPEREQVVQQLFVKAGARPDEIVKQSAGRGRNNYYVVKKGKTDRIVVVGGHHDKVSEGHGTIDNWTGATMVINLYQAMKDVETDATYIFVAFGREEEGLIGSEAFLRQMPQAQRAKLDSMVNLDTLGVDGTYSWKNNSTQALLDLIRQVATTEGRALVEAYLDGGDADSSTFRNANIPAMTIFGASQDVIFDIIHTGRDTMAAFSLPHYVNAYYLTLALLKALDDHPIGGAAAGA